MIIISLYRERIGVNNYFFTDGNQIGENTQRAAVKSVGSWAGATAGARLGIMAGSYLPPYGPIIGGFVGGVAGGIGGRISL